MIGRSSICPFARGGLPHGHRKLLVETLKALETAVVLVRALLADDATGVGGITAVGPVAFRVGRDTDPPSILVAAEWRDEYVDRRSTPSFVVFVVPVGTENLMRIVLSSLDVRERKPRSGVVALDSVGMELRNRDRSEDADGRNDDEDLEQR